MVLFGCPTCGARLQHPQSAEKVSCPHCGQRILVPDTPPPKPAAGNPTVLGSWEDAPPPVRGNTPAASSPTDSRPVAVPVSPPGPNGAPPVQVPPPAQDADGGEGPPPPPAKGAGAKFCHECGAIIRGKAKICPECGVPQPAKHRRREAYRFDGEPHRGTAILVMGVLSLFIMPLPLGLLAWIWANEDLRKMNAGRMDPEGRGMTQAGKVCGILSSVLALASCCVVLVYFLVIGLFMAGISGSMNRQINDMKQQMNDLDTPRTTVRQTKPTSPKP